VIVLAVVTGGATNPTPFGVRQRSSRTLRSCTTFVLAIAMPSKAGEHARRALSIRHLVDERLSRCDCRPGLSIPRTRATIQPVREPRRVREREATELHQHEHLVNILDDATRPWFESRQRAEFERMLFRALGPAPWRKGRKDVSQGRVARSARDARGGAEATLYSSRRHCSSSAGSAR
jgi:hypothetical protein